MRLLFWIASKNLASRRLHAICAILGIAFGVATVCAIQIVDFNTVKGVREHHRRFTGNPELVLSIKNLERTNPTEAITALEREAGIEAFSPLLTDHVGLTTGAGKMVSAPFFALRPGMGLAFDAYGSDQGRALESEDQGVFLVGPKGAQEWGLKIGQTYSLQRPSIMPSGCADGKLVRLEEGATKAGPAVALKLVGILADHHLGRANAGRALILPWTDGRKLMGTTPFFPRFWLKLAEGVRRSDLDSRLAKNFNIEVPEARAVGESPEERAFRSGVRLASFMALGLGLFIIYHLLTLAVTSWVRQVGLLGALGIKARTLVGIFLAEAGVLAILGSAIGLGVGIALAKFMLERQLTTLGWGRPVLTFDLPWPTLGAVMLAGCIACLIGAIIPIMRLRRVSTLDALQQGEAALGDAKPPKWVAPLVIAAAPAAALGMAWLLHPMDPEFIGVSFAVCGLFGVFVFILWALPGKLGAFLSGLLKPLERPHKAEAFLVRKGMERGVRRFAGSVTGLSIVAAGLVTLHGMTGALKREKDTWADQALERTVFVDLQRQEALGLNWLTGIPGVESAVPLNAVLRQGTMEVRGVPAQELFASGLFAQDPGARRAFEAGQGAVITKSLARRAKLGPGDPIALSSLKGRISLDVLAVTDSYGFWPHEQAYALISEGIMRQAFCRTNEVVTHVALKLDEESQASTVVSQIASEAEARNVPLNRVWDGELQREEYRDEINRDFALFDIILLLTALLAAVGLLNSLLVTGLERQKETALLRTVGMTRGQIFRLFLSEAALLGVTSGILGSIMGMGFSVMVIFGLKELSGLPLTWQWEPLWMLAAILMLTVVAALASLLPAWRAGRRDVISAIKAE